MSNPTRADFKAAHDAAILIGCQAAALHRAAAGSEPLVELLKWALRPLIQQPEYLDGDDYCVQEAFRRAGVYDNRPFFLWTRAAGPAASCFPFVLSWFEATARAASAECSRRMASVREHLLPIGDPPRRLGPIVRANSHEVMEALGPVLSKAIDRVRRDHPYEPPIRRQSPQSWYSSHYPEEQAEIPPSEYEVKYRQAMTIRRPLEEALAYYPPEQINVEVECARVEYARAVASLPADAPANTAPPEPAKPRTIDRKQQARNKWIYQQACSLKPYKQIRVELNALAKSKGWRPVSSEQGIRQAAIEYATANNLPPPPTRRSN